MTTALADTLTYPLPVMPGHPRLPFPSACRHTEGGTKGDIMKFRGAFLLVLLPTVEAKEKTLVTNHL